MDVVAVATARTQSAAPAISSIISSNNKNAAGSSDRISSVAICWIKLSVRVGRCAGLHHGSWQDRRTSCEPDREKRGASGRRVIAATWRRTLSETSRSTTVTWRSLFWKVRHTKGAAFGNGWRRSSLWLRRASSVARPTLGLWPTSASRVRGAPRRWPSGIRRSPWRPCSLSCSTWPQRPTTSFATRSPILVYLRQGIGMSQKETCQIDATLVTSGKLDMHLWRLPPLREFCSRSAICCKRWTSLNCRAPAHAHNQCVSRCPLFVGKCKFGQ